MFLFLGFGRNRKPLLKGQRVVAVIAQTKQCKASLAADVDREKTLFRFGNGGQALHCVVQRIAKQNIQIKWVHKCQRCPICHASPLDAALFAAVPCFAQ